MDMRAITFQTSSDFSNVSANPPGCPVGFGGQRHPPVGLERPHHQPRQLSLFRFPGVPPRHVQQFSFMQRLEATVECLTRNSDVVSTVRLFLKYNMPSACLICEFPFSLGLVFFPRADVRWFHLVVSCGRVR